LEHLPPRQLHGASELYCGGQAMVGGVVPDMASITMDIIRRIKKNKVAAAAEPARACNLARDDNVREG